MILPAVDPEIGRETGVSLTAQHDSAGRLFNPENLQRVIGRVLHL